jgi:hypothetical protein
MSGLLLFGRVLFARSIAMRVAEHVQLPITHGQGAYWHRSPPPFRRPVKDPLVTLRTTTLSWPLIRVQGDVAKCSITELSRWPIRAREHREQPQSDGPYVRTLQVVRATQRTRHHQPGLVVPGSVDVDGDGVPACGSIGWWRGLCLGLGHPFAVGGPHRDRVAACGCLPDEHPLAP